jgi:Chaperone of endosialidase
MKKIIALISVCMFAAVVVRADTALTIPAIYGCLADFGSVVGIPNPPTVTGTFTLTNVSGTGTITSQVPGYWNETYGAGGPVKLYIYNYTIDLSAMSSPSSHCVRLLIHFGDPAGCFTPGVEGNPSQIQSATLGPWGDINFVFNSGCVSPGQSAISFGMVSVAGYKTNVVTVIDDYVNPANGLTNEVRINVPAIVPDIAPDPPPWEIAYYYSRVNPIHLQGLVDVGTNQLGGVIPVTNGNYDFLLQLVLGPTNGPVISQAVTNTVPVVNGVFNVPLPGDPGAYQGGLLGNLLIGLRPSGSGGGFTQLNPLPIAPTAQAMFAFSAGTVADLTPGQAVTSLNGLTDAVNLQAGSGIILGTNGNTLTISAQPGVPSDRNIKTDFAPLDAENILERLTALPMLSWRYTNEMSSVRHVGPMAQDFRAAFGLGHDDKFIEFVDEEGVALTAIQALNEKIKEQKVELEQKQAEITELKQRLEKVEQFIKNGKSDTK